MSKVYVITSGKGGVGKTSTAVNLGAALNRFKEDVIVVDANLSTPNLGIHFGAPIVPVSLSTVLQGKADITEAIYEHESGLKIVPSSLSLRDLQKINFKLMEDVTKKLKKISSYVIFDSAAGLGEEARTAMMHADEVLIVTNPNILSVTDSLKAVKLAQELKKTVAGVIITRVKDDKNEMPLNNIQDMLEIPILGVVPEDPAVSESLVRKNSVVETKPRSKAGKAYTDIAAKLLGKKRRPESYFEKLMSKLGIR